MYLFILCPPYCGSTVLWKLICTSKNVSSLPSEGQFLPEVADVMRQAPWDAAFEMPWAQIKSVWDEYWDQSCSILIEKSPPNILRVDMIKKHFIPCQFVIMVRNPYAHCEGLMRRNGWSPKEAAKFAIRCLKLQNLNRAKLPGAFCLTYEQMALNPIALADQLSSFLPQLGSLSPCEMSNVHSNHSVGESSIIDLNRKNLFNLAGRNT